MDPVVILASVELTLTSGDMAQVRARVLNRSRRVESYRIDVVGEAAPYATADPVEISVLPGREESVQITFVAPSGPAARPGTHHFGVRAVSEVDPTSSALAEGRLELIGAGGVHAWFPETAASGRWTGRYQLALDNRGNAAVRLAVTAHESTGELRLEVMPDMVELLPGAPTSVAIEAKARRPYLRGTPATRMFQVATHDFPFGAERPLPGAAADPDDPHHHQFQLAFEQRPILAKWVLIAGALCIVLAIALVAIRLQGGSRVELTVGEPFTPFDFEVTALGSSEVALAWLAVPNAVGYEVWPSERDGTTPADAEAVVVEAAATTVDELAPSTEVCFKVRSVGFDDQKSDFTETRCAATGAVAQVPAPTDVTAVAPDATTIQVEWSYPIDALEAVTAFILIVDNKELPDRFVKIDGGRQMATFTIAASTSQREVGIRVRAETTDQSSDASPEFKVSVPAVPVPTVPTAPATSAPAPVTDPGSGGTGGGTGGGAGGASTPTTLAPTTTSTVAPSTTSIPPLVVGPISDLDPQFQDTWAVMVPQIQSGGVAADQLKEQLAAAVGSTSGAVRDFFNRDKVVNESLEPNHPVYTADFISGLATTIGALPPEQRWLYLTVLDGETAAAACADLIAQNPRCVAARLRSAGHPQAVVRPLERLPRNTDTDEIDARLVELREDNPTFSIHLLDPTNWREFDDDAWVLFARVTPENEAQLCTTEGACPTLTPSS